MPKPTPELRARALQLLARREHARAELRQKLLAHGDEESINVLLNDFTARGWLSDERFAEQWSHQRSQRYGTQRLKQELRQKGVADDTIAATLEDLAGSEAARARAVWERKFGQLPTDARERARQARFLASRGFSLDLVYQILGGHAED